MNQLFNALNIIWGTLICCMKHDFFNNILQIISDYFQNIFFQYLMFISHVYFYIGFLTCHFILDFKKRVKCSNFCWEATRPLNYIETCHISSKCHFISITQYQGTAAILRGLRSFFIVDQLRFVEPFPSPEKKKSFLLTSQILFRKQRNLHCLSIFSSHVFAISIPFLNVCRVFSGEFVIVLFLEWIHCFCPRLKYFIVVVSRNEPPDGVSRAWYSKHFPLT